MPILYLEINGVISNGKTLFCKLDKIDDISSGYARNTTVPADSMGRLRMGSRVKFQYVGFNVINPIVVDIDTVDIVALRSTLERMIPFNMAADWQVAVVASSTTILFD